MPASSVEDRINVNQDEYLKRIRNEVAVGAFEFQNIVRNEINEETGKKHGKTQAYIADVLGVSTSVISKIKSERPYSSPYTFKLSLKLSLFAAGDVAQFLKLMSYSGHCKEKYDVHSDEMRMISYAVSIYSTGSFNWEERMSFIRMKYGSKYGL